MIGGKSSVCYSMVKNEEDIIEIFVRHNLRFFEHIFITDNNSSDNTVTIIESLIQEGLPITLWHDHTLAYEQSRITTEAYHKISTLLDFDLFFPLDADELLTVSADFHGDLIQEDICYEITHMNYVTSNPNDQTINMIRRFKTTGISKVFINQKAIKYKKILIEQGNHGVRYII